MSGKIITALGVALVSGSLAFAAPVASSTNSRQAKPVSTRATLNQASTAKTTSHTHKKHPKRNASTRSTASSSVKPTGSPSKGAPAKR